MHGIFVETGLTDILDVNRVAIIGGSGSAVAGSCSNVIMEKHTDFHLKMDQIGARIYYRAIFVNYKNFFQMG